MARGASRRLIWDMVRGDRFALRGVRQSTISATTAALSSGRRDWIREAIFRANFKEGCSNPQSSVPLAKR